MGKGTLLQQASQLPLETIPDKNTSQTERGAPNASRSSVTSSTDTGQVGRQKWGTPEVAASTGFVLCR